MIEPAGIPPEHTRPHQWPLAAPDEFALAALDDALDQFDRQLTGFRGARAHGRGSKTRVDDLSILLMLRRVRFRR
jgi:hypothetical protein